jgi:membrane protease YdiL (CAAX protease family)
MQPSRSASPSRADLHAALCTRLGAVGALLREAMRQADAQRQPVAWGWPVALAALVLVYANGLAWLGGPRQAEPSALLATGNVASVPALLVAVALLYRRRWSALGFERCSFSRAGALGAATGAVMALPAIAVFALPPLMGEPLRWEVASAMSARDVALRLFVHLTIGTALFEEVLFRGLLWNLAARAWGTAAAWLGTSVVFALWHVVLTVHSVGQTNVPDELTPLAVTLGLLGVFGGGLVFGALRLASGLLAATVAHWTVDALILGALLLQ